MLEIRALTAACLGVHPCGLALYLLFALLHQKNVGQAIFFVYGDLV